MELLICQGCGVVLRTRGKHCTGCGVPLALNAPTVIPVFSQTRPPLSVSVKQDHLLIERVVTQRQVVAMGSRPTLTGSQHYAVASGSSFPTSISSPVADYGVSKGNGGNGHNGGNSHNGDNGGNGGNSNGADSAVQPAPPELPPVKEAEAVATVEPDNLELVAADLFGVEAAEQALPVTQEPPTNSALQTPSVPPVAAEPTTPGSGSSSSLMSSLTNKGLLAAGAAGFAAGLGAGLAQDANNKGPLSALSDWVGNASRESQASVTSAQNPPAPVPEPEPDKTTGLGQGNLMQSYFNPGLATNAISIAIGTQVPNPAMPSATSVPKSLSAFEASPVSESNASSSSAAGEPGADFVLPSEVEQAADVLSSNKMSPIGENKAGSVKPIAATETEKSDENARGAFDFVNQFGSDFNPDEFFNTGANKAIAAPSNQQPEEEKSDVSEVEQTPEPDAEEPGKRQDLMDFFGESETNSSAVNISTDAPSESHSVSLAAPSQTPAAQDDAFDFFSGSPSKSRPIESISDSIAAAEAALAAMPPSSQERLALVVGEKDTEEEETKDERPKVAMPRGLTGKTKSSGYSELKDQNDDTDNSDESDGDDAEVADSESRPKRRSFSGNSIKPQKVKSKKDEDDDDNDDNDSDGEDEKALGAAGMIDWMDAEVSLGALNVNRKTAIVICAVGVFILAQIPGWCITFFQAATGGSQPQQAQQQQVQQQQAQQQQAQQQQQAAPQGVLGLSRSIPGLGGQPRPMPNQGMPNQGQQMPQGNGQASGAAPVMAGQWQVITYAGNKPYPSKMIINQNGTQFAGQGQDGFGLFEVAGILRPPARMDFKKSYDKEAERKGAITEPMIYSGTLETDPTTNLLTVSGGWKSHKRQGFESSIYHPAEMVEIGGRYQAKQLMAQTPAAPSNNVLASLPHLNAGGMNPLGALAPGHGTNKIETAQHTFLTIALACIGVGVLIFLFFLMLFGPSGKMNVWEKQKYIPSQFKAQHMKMVRELGKTLTPGATPFGKRLEWDWWWPFTPKSLALPADLRVQNPHMLILGGGDKGKTRLIAHMISHDIRSADRAVVVIDSDGQLSDMVIEWIASQPEGKEFSKRVILVDPTYKAGSVAYNPLEMPEDGDLQAASSAIVHGFKAIYTEPPGAQSQWNAQTANILRNASLLLMANGRTLTDLPNLLQDNDFRDIMLESVERRKSEKTEYITLLETWNQYKKLARTDQWINWVEPILNRVGPMLSDGRIRPILTKPVSDLKLKELIIDRKILIVKVPQGELDQNANLLGSLIVTGLQQAAMSMSKGKREVEVRPVALYIDEMDNFIEKETIENLTSETKRYQVGFVGCLKTLQHLPEDYRSQLIINMGTLCVFALAKKDGDMLGPQMFRVDGRKIKHQTIQNFFNKVNTSPQFELIMDEEKLNIDRIVGQEMQTYFCYRVGTVAGTFKLKAHDFKDPPERKIDRRLVDKMHALVDDVDDKKKSRKKKGK